MPPQRRVVNRNLAATSVVRLIEAIAPPEPDMPANVILKPRETKKRLPGSKLLIQMAKEREKEKLKRQAARARPVIDPEAVEEAIDGILADLSR